VIDYAKFSHGDKSDEMQYNNMGGVPFGSSYVCHKVLPKQIVFESLTADKRLSRMYGDVEQIGLSIKTEKE
jgi:hypothetical protein